MIVIIIILLAIIVFFAYFFIYRLNIYISGLEKKISKLTELTENLKQSLKDLVEEGFLLNDGRLKKFNIQNENRKVIYNGVKVEEQISEI